MIAASNNLSSTPLRDRLRAATWHLLVTVVVALPAAALVFLIWYPQGLARMLGGVELFQLVVGCDLVLGPAISLVIFNRAKPIRELVRDYAAVAFVQLSALGYGLHVVSLSRPVFVAFVKDRLEVVTRIELDRVDLDAALGNPYAEIPVLGPRKVGIALPTDEKERADALFQAVAGKDFHLRPKFYDDYAKHHKEIIAKLLPLEELAKRKGKGSAETLKAFELAGSQPDGVASVGWIPVRYRFGFGVALLDNKSARLVAFAPIDPG